MLYYDIHAYEFMSVATSFYYSVALLWGLGPLCFERRVSPTTPLYSEGNEAFSIHVLRGEAREVRTLNPKP